jgi:hypothetical protein
VPIITLMSPGPEAWHEAGHALVAHLLNGVVRELSLESELDGLAGHAAVQWPEAVTEQEAARRHAFVALAGPVAELVFRGEDVLRDPHALSTWRGDWDEAQSQLNLRHMESEPREAGLRAMLAQLHEHFTTADG